MEKRRHFRILPFLIMGVFLVFASSCEKDDDNDPSSINPTNGKTTAVFNPAVTYGTMTDQDGNVYKTVTIGTQTWMAENLRTTKYKDGKSIPNVTSASEWENLTTGAYCNYNNTSITDTIATYGRLYNWYAVNTTKLAPKGWHVATDAEWSTLTGYLEGESVAGDKLKEIDTTHWSSPKTEATNGTGFTALPGGYHFCRFSSGTYFFMGTIGHWWSSTEFSTNSAYLRGMNYNVSAVNRIYGPKDLGISVRCVRD
jgi:uncharacterized protein (TIGR02145 family)